MSHNPFHPPLASDSRSPCPALNALANHGYLPHDGKNVTLPMLTRALQTVYKLTIPLSWILALGGVLRCGNGWKLDLHDLAYHNRLEHDASLVHEDAAPGERYAPTDVSPDLLESFLSHSSDGKHLTFDELATIRYERSQTLSKPLDSLQSHTAGGELAGLIGAFQDTDGRVPIDHVRAWLGEGRLPDGWEAPIQPISVGSTLDLMKKITKVVEESASLPGRRSISKD